jgi:hypothetical protein
VTAILHSEDSDESLSICLPVGRDARADVVLRFKNRCAVGAAV